MMDELKPAQPQSLGERLLGLMYGGTDAESEYYKRQAREAELRRMEQKAFEDQGGGLEAQIPGGNPEAPTPLDALVGALMSMGGVPSSVARSGTAPTIPAPRPAQKNSMLASEPEWMSSAPGGRVRIGPPIQEMNRTIRDQERDARPAGMPIGPKLIGPTVQERNKALTRIETPDGFVIEPPDKSEGVPIYRVGKRTPSGVEWFEGANSFREAKAHLERARNEPAIQERNKILESSPPPEPAVENQKIGTIAKIGRVTSEERTAAAAKGLTVTQLRERRAWAGSKLHQKMREERASQRERFGVKKSEGND